MVDLKNASHCTLHVIPCTTLHFACDTLHHNPISIYVDLCCVRLFLMRYKSYIHVIQTRCKVFFVVITSKTIDYWSYYRCMAIIHLLISMEILWCLIRYYNLKHIGYAYYLSYFVIIVWKFMALRVQRLIRGILGNIRCFNWEIICELSLIINGE